MAENMNPEVPSDVVELIIAVDLNPSDPEEPINVNDVKVSPKGEGGEDGEDWKGLATQLLMGDPASGVTSDKISFEEATEAVSRVLEGDDGGEGADPFSKASRSEPRAPERPSKPKKKSGGGMKAALDRALGKPGDDEDEDEEEEL